MSDLSPANLSPAASVPLPTPPLLSLCLPTYKRAPLLRQALDAVLTQISVEDAADVEVFVLDNASPDDTPAVIEEAQQRAPHVPLRCVRHPKNIGMDANFLEAIRQAHGRFVCLLSDDDILLPGAIVKLLSLIRAHPDFDGVCLNARSFTDNPFDGEPWLDLAEDKMILDRNELLQLVAGHITFLSILAFNKSRIAQALEVGQYQDKIGTYFLQCYFFLKVIAGQQGIVATAQPMVAQRVENAHSLNYFQVFVTEYNALLDYAAQLGYSRDIIRRNREDNLVGARYFIAAVKIYNRQSELWSSPGDAIRRLFRVHWFRPYLWLVVVPLIFFPRPLRPIVHLVRHLLGRTTIEERNDASEAGNAFR